MSVWIALLLLCIAGIAFAIGDAERILDLDPQQFAAVAAGVALFLLIVPGLLRSYSGRAASAVRDLVTWVAIGFVLLAGYSYRDAIGQIAYRIAGELAPPGTVVSVDQSTSGERSVRIRRRSDGHFIATVGVNGSTVSMLVDTGASTVVLRDQDARKLGVDVKQLKYTVPVQTANGLAYAAHVRLRSVAIGPITIPGVDALIAQPNVLKESLLGMTFLSRLRSYEFAGDSLTFRN
jgi:aspartyl protease family protein